MNILSCNLVKLKLNIFRLFAKQKFYQKIVHDQTYYIRLTKELLRVRKESLLDLNLIYYGKD
jgi:hypothetical protein